MVVVLNEVSYLKCLTRKCWVVNQCSINVSGSFDPHNCYCRHRKWWNIELIWRKGILYSVCLSLWSAGGGRKDSKGVGLWPWSARPLSFLKRMLWLVFLSTWCNLGREVPLLRNISNRSACRQVCGAVFTTKDWCGRASVIVGGTTPRSVVLGYKR